MFNWLRRSKKDPEEIKLSGYHQFLIRRDRDTDIMNQEFEDQRIDRYIESEAHRLFLSWKYSEILDFGDGEKFRLSPGIIITGGTIYSIYDDDTARHKKLSTFTDIIIKRYNELKEEHIKLHPDDKD